MAKKSGTGMETAKLTRREVGSIISDRDEESKPGELGESNDEEAGESPDNERLEIEAADNGVTVHTHARQPKKETSDVTPYTRPVKHVFADHAEFMKHVSKHTSKMFGRAFGPKIA